MLYIQFSHLLTNFLYYPYMDRLNEITGELLMIWGRQDPYIPTKDRADIQAKLNAANLLLRGMSLTHNTLLCVTVMSATTHKLQP